MRQQFYIFLVRWLLNTIGIWVSVRLFGSNVQMETMTALAGTFLLAGFIFSIVNSILKPIVIILSLPAILLTLGLFTLVVNGLMVYISLGLAPGLEMTFSNSILAGIVMSLVNYIVSSAVRKRDVARVNQ